MNEKKEAGNILLDSVYLFRYPLEMEADEMPFPCCDHCGCGTPDSVWPERTGHDDTCLNGCNDHLLPMTEEQEEK